MAQRARRKASIPAPHGEAECPRLGAEGAAEEIRAMSGTKASAAQRTPAHIGEPAAPAAGKGTCPGCLSTCSLLQLLSCQPRSRLRARGGAGPGEEGWGRGQASVRPWDRLTGASPLWAAKRQVWEHKPVAWPISPLFRDSSARSLQLCSPPCSWERRGRGH